MISGRAKGATGRHISLFLMQFNDRFVEIEVLDSKYCCTIHAEPLSVACDRHARVKQCL